MSLSVDDLLLFARVVDAGTLGAAARRLEIPKATLSRRLAVLQAAIGTQLFVPGARKLALTDFGHAVAERANTQLQEFRELSDWLTHANDEPSGLLRLLCPAEFAAGALAEPLTTFVNRFPKVRLEIDSAQLFERLDPSAKPFDLAIRFGEQANSSFVARRLMSFSRSLYASPVYLGQYGMPQRPEELAQHRVLQFAPYKESIQLHFNGKPGKRSFRLVTNRMIVMNGMAVYRSFCNASAGIALLPDWFGKLDVAQGRLVSVLPKWQAESNTAYMMIPSRSYLPRKTRALMDHLYESVPRGMK